MNWHNPSMLPSVHSVVLDIFTFATSIIRHFDQCSSDHPAQTKIHTIRWTGGHLPGHRLIQCLLFLLFASVTHCCGGIPSMHRKGRCLLLLCSTSWHRLMRWTLPVAPRGSVPTVLADFLSFFVSWLAFSTYYHLEPTYHNHSRVLLWLSNGILTLIMWLPPWDL